MMIRCVNVDKLSSKRRRFIKTVRRWTWRLSSAKKCVTTYEPNESALKMDREIVIIPKHHNTTKAVVLVEGRGV